MSSWGAIFNNTRFALKTQSDAMAKLQESIASGERVIRASDDPIATNRIMYLNSFLDSLDSYSNNLNNVDSLLGLASSNLSEISSALGDVRKALTDAANGTYTSQQRSMFAGRLDTAMHTILMAVNVEYAGQHVFGGANVSESPYVAQYNGAGEIIGVTYQGSTVDMPTLVGPGITYSGVQVGENLFKSDSPDSPLFSGSTGAAVGTKQSTIDGEVTLTVSRQTTYDANAVVLAAGTSANNSDTIRGDHTLTVDSAAKTIKLDGGVAVSYDGAATPEDFMVESASGDVVYVDVRNIVGSGSVTISGQGLLSIDGGTTWAQTDYADNNLAVGDPAKGKVLYVNTVGITSTGSETVIIPDSLDLFADLIKIRDALKNDANLSDSEVKDLLSDGNARITGQLKSIASHQITIGSKINSVGTVLRYRIEDMKYGATVDKSINQDADFTELAVELARVQTLYEMILISSSKMLKLSLLDYI